MDKVPTGVRFFEFLGILSGLALLTIFSWFVKRILRGRKYRRMVSTEEIGHEYSSETSGHRFPGLRANYLFGSIRLQEAKFHLLTGSLVLGDSYPHLVL